MQTKTTKTETKLAGRVSRRLGGFAVSIVTSIVMLGMGAPGASADVDIYTVTSVGPSNLVAGQSGRLFVELNNKGDTASPFFADPRLTVKVDLPPNVSSTGKTPEFTAGFVWECSGTTTVTCTSIFSLPAFAGNLGVVFSIGQPAAIMLDVEVAPGAGSEGTFPLTITTSGGEMAGPSVETRPLTIAGELPSFGVHGLTAGAFDDEGNDYTQAGGHPHDVKADFSLNIDQVGIGGIHPAVPSGGPVRDVVVDTPPGFIGDPNATPKCSQSDLARGNALAASDGCPHSTQVGTVLIRTPSIGNFEEGVYNMEPPRSLPAQFAFWTPAGIVRIEPAVRSDGDYGLTTTVNRVSQADVLLRSSLVLWGNPADPSHDAQRCWSLNIPTRSCVGVTTQGNPSPANVPHDFEAPEKAFLTLQTNCVQTPVSTLYLDKWNDPAPMEDLTDPRWTSEDVITPIATGCEQVPFDPTMSLQPTTKQADSPTGLDVHVHFPREKDDEPEELVQAHLKKATVNLPEGFAFNTGIADGLEACSPAQIGLTSAPGQEPIRFNNVEPSCPDASKIGTGEVISPLLDDHLLGEVFLAAQKANPFNSNYAIYVVVREPSILVKLAGEVVPDKQTGQITVTFDQNPQLPFEDFLMHFYDGPRGALATPVTCGTFSSQTVFEPWSAKDPDNPTAEETVTINDPFTIDSAPNGQGCVSAKAQLPFNIGLNAGSKDPVAGARSPFSVRITRPDANQELDRLEISPPLGFTATLKGIPYCPEAQIASAITRESGKAEQQSPSCPVASEVGTTNVGAGAGSQPFYAPGKVYLSGPYKGEKLSVVVITPAVAGPFDLGNVVVRSALKLNPRTAQITAVTDPLPKTIEGVPLRVRDIRVDLDRPNWAINPTSCEEKQVKVTAIGTEGAISRPSNRYQLDGCKGLGFKPKLSIRFKGGTKRGDHPALIAKLTTRKGDANIASAAVTLPRSAFLDQSHIRTICTRVQFAAETCPKGATYGFASVITPLLDDPLEGNVILRSSDNKLPDLVGDLKGVADIEAVGRIDSIKGGIRNTFDIVPDAPFDSFTLSMQGGKKGLVVNSQNLCGKAHRATVRLTAHNGRRYNFRPKVVATGCAKGRKQKPGGGKRRG